ncbi:MAG TPA: DUF4203 domain-containing protein [Candidatus Limnocylindria bacterium]|nr:DUF4203 domain-containing protein [Candidatus Limnocylindria bacterium]
MDLLIALILIAVGAAALFAGFKLWLVLLPIFGLVVGFVAGTEIVSTLLGSGFLQNVIGIVVGAVVAVLFAVLALFWWWAAVVLVIAGFGFAIGYGLLPAIGMENAEVLSWVIGLTIAAIFAVAAVVLRLPRALVIVATSLWGSGAVLAGALVILNQVEVENLGYGAVDQVIGQSFFWFVAWLVLAVVGMAAQAFTSDPISLVPEDAGGWGSRSGVSSGTP